MTEKINAIEILLYNKNVPYYTKLMLHEIKVLEINAT